MFFFRRKQKKAEIVEPVAVPQETKTRMLDTEPPSAASPAPRKRRRPNANKTRLMGFDASDGRVVDLFDEEKKATESTRFQYPVGLVMVIKGPGLGESFALKSGMSQIGRGEDQAVCLDFGDMAVSRTNHAAIVYDADEHTFLLGHGGKSNIVRLNGKPVVSTSDLANGDTIEIGETQMRFVALCDHSFNWDTTEAEKEGAEDDDLEIA